MRRQSHSQHVRQLINLQQMAALVDREVGTLRAYRCSGHKNPMPEPFIQGGGRRRHLWDYQVIRPWLQVALGVPVPDTYPYQCVTLPVTVSMVS